MTPIQIQSLVQERMQRLDRERNALAQLAESAPTETCDAKMIEVPLGPLAEIQRRAFLAALVATGYNKTKAAELLCVSRRSVYNWLANEARRRGAPAAEQAPAQEQQKEEQAPAPPEPRGKGRARKVPEDALEQIAQRAGKESLTALAREYGVSRQRIGQIAKARRVAA